MGLPKGMTVCLKCARRHQAVVAIVGRRTQCTACADTADCDVVIGSVIQARAVAPAPAAAPPPELTDDEVLALTFIAAGFTVIILGILELLRY